VAKLWRIVLSAIGAIYAINRGCEYFFVMSTGAADRSARGAGYLLGCAVATCFGLAIALLFLALEYRDPVAKAGIPFANRLLVWIGIVGGGYLAWMAYTSRNLEIMNMSHILIGVGLSIVAGSSVYGALLKPRSHK
jgi:hypothetical protein